MLQRTHRLASMAVAFVGLFGVPAAQAQEAQLSQTDFYAVGQQFAYCSAHWAFAAEVARANGLEDAAIGFEGMERGWSLAGAILLVDGLHPSRQTEVEAIFGNMKQIGIERLRAEREVARANGDTGYDARSGDRFQEECGHLSDIQKAIIRELRSGPA
jgi:hypothetical protein